MGVSGAAQGATATGGAAQSAANGGPALPPDGTTTRDGRYGGVDVTTDEESNTTDEESNGTTEGDRNASSDGGTETTVGTESTATESDGTIVLDDAGGRAPVDAGVTTTGSGEVSVTERIPPEERFELQSQIFTVSDIVLFGYRNGTRVGVQDRNLTLNETDIEAVEVPEGTYGVSGSKPFAALSGDPLSQSVSGYYATDENGFPVSERLKTWVPKEVFGNEKLIVFGYENGTSVEIRDQETGELVANGTLDRGGHLELSVNEGVSGESYVVVEADRPVSVLTHFDQGYYVPAASGTYTGTEFYTYATDIAASAHELVVNAYTNETSVEITNTETGETVWSGRLDAGEVHSESFTDPTYLAVETDAPASVSLQPFDEYRNSRYFHGLYVPSSSGSFIGSDFVETSTDSDHMFVFGYENGTEVTVLHDESPLPQTYTLDRGEAVDVSRGAGVYRVISEKPVSVHAGYSEFSAGFAPVKFGDVETGAVSGVVRDPAGNTLPDRQVFVVPMRELFRLPELANIVESGELPEDWYSVRTDEDGGFTVRPVDPGRYVVVTLDRTDGEYRLDYRTDVFVTEGRTVRVALQFQNPLSPLEPGMEGLREDYEAVLRSNSRAAADVYVTGHDEFAGETAIDRATPSNALGATIDTVGFAVDVAGNAANPRRAIAEELSWYIAENVVFAGQEQQVDRIAITMSPPEVRDDVGPNAREVQETEWLMDFEHVESEDRAYARGHTDSEIYEDSVSGLEDEEERFEQIVQETDRSELADELSVVAVREAIEKQREMVRGEGPARGVIITPKGTVYLVEQTQEHREEFYRAKAGAESAGTATKILDSVGTVAGAVALLNPEPSTKAAATAVATASTAGSIATQQLQVAAEYKMATDYANTQIYWAADADDTVEAYSDTVDWVEAETENPRAHTASGRVARTDIGAVSPPWTEKELVVANRPDYPAWAQTATLLTPFLPPGLPQYAAEKTSSIEVENTGDTESEARIVVVDYVGEGDSPTDMPSLRPEPAKDPYTLAPGESREVEIRYRADFKTLSPFEYHYQTTYLWMDGRVVGEETDVYYIVPSLDNPVDDIPNPFSADAEASDTERGMRTSRFAYASNHSDGAMSLEEFSSLYGSSTELVKTELSPSNASTGATFRLSNASNTRNVTFLMVTESGRQVNLNVYDEFNRHVGFAPALGRDETQIPRSTYSGNTTNPQVVTVGRPESDEFRVTANATSFPTNESVSVQVFAITDPERPALVGVRPGRVDAYGTTGGTARGNVSLAEIGGQRSVENVTLSLGQFETANGTELPSGVDVRLAGESGFDLNASERRSTAVVTDATGAESLATDRTRFDGTLRVRTDNAGSVGLNASVLLLDTSAENLSLVGANATVEGVHAEPLSVENDSTGPDDAEPIEGYDLRVVGDGSVVLRTTGLDSNDTVGLRAYARTDGSWDRIDVETGRRNATVVAPASADRVVLARPHPNLTVSLLPDPASVRPAPTTGETVTYAGANVTVEAFERTLGTTVSGVTVEHPDGSVIDASPVEGERWHATTRFENSTYNASTGEYDAVRLTVEATGETGVPVETTTDVEVRRPGDATGDGETDIRDAVVVGRAFGSNRSTDRYAFAADLDNDGRVTESDLRSLEAAIRADPNGTTNESTGPNGTTTGSVDPDREAGASAASARGQGDVPGATARSAGHSVPLGVTRPARATGVVP